MLDTNDERNNHYLVPPCPALNPGFFRRAGFTCSIPLFLAITIGL